MRDENGDLIRPEDVLDGAELDLHYRAQAAARHPAYRYVERPFAEEDHASDVEAEYQRIRRRGGV